MSQKGTFSLLLLEVLLSWLLAGYVSLQDMSTILLDDLLPTPPLPSENDIEFLFKRWQLPPSRS